MEEERDTASSLRDRLVAFYSTYNIAKLPDVDRILEQYKGNENALMAALTKKYGPEPTFPLPLPKGEGPAVVPRPADSAALLSPPDSSAAAVKAAEFSGASGRCLENETYAFRDRFVNFYRKYNPEKLTDVPSILAKFHGQEDAVLTAMIKKYGPEPRMMPFWMLDSRPPGSSAPPPHNPGDVAAKPLTPPSDPFRTIAPECSDRLQCPGSRTPPSDRSP